MKSQYDLLAEQMDKRENFFKLLKEFEEKHGFIPEKYKDTMLEFEYNRYKKKGSWRNNKWLVRKLRKAADKMERNK